jgi:hypothetical protein
MIIFGIILVLMLILRREGLIPVSVRTYGFKNPQAVDDPTQNRSTSRRIGST